MKQFKELSLEFSKQWAYHTVIGYAAGMIFLGAFSYFTRND